MTPSTPSQGPINFLGASQDKFVPTEAPPYWVEWMVRPGVEACMKEMLAFRRRVNRMINRGYVPVGGISITIEYGSYMVAQAMIKKSAVPEPLYVGAVEAGDSLRYPQGLGGKP